MKRAIACLLTLCLILQLPFGVPQVFAENNVAPVETGSEAEQTAGSTETEVSSGNDVTNETGNGTGGVEYVSNARSNSVQTRTTGRLEVQIKSLYDFSAGKTFNVKLGEHTQTVTLERDSSGNFVSAVADFDELPLGTYELTVQGSQYMKYTQKDIKIESFGLDYRIELYTAYEDIFRYFEAEEEKHPGVILLGDVTGDGEVTDDDADKIIELLDKTNLSDEEKNLADLNRDGKVDLVDLQYVAVSLSETNERNSKPEDGLSAVFAEVATSNVSIVSENMKTESGKQVNEVIFSESEENVQLTPADSTAQISKTNPVEIGLTLAGDDSPGVPMESIIVKSPANSNNAPSNGEIIVLQGMEDGTDQVITIPFSKPEAIISPVGAVGIPGILKIANDGVTVDENGNIVVDLGGQIAVKKVTIKVTGTTRGSNLAEISQVEFLNGMENRIPKPDLSIPDGLKVENGSKFFNLTWNAQQNVTGYEVEIVHKPSGGAQGSTITVITDTNALTMTAFNGEELKNYDVFVLRVRSVNGEWRSDYSGTVEAKPIPSGKPSPPDNVVAVGGKGCISVSWKNMKDTLTYQVHYREEGQENAITTDPIKGTSYVITLESSEKKTYYVWVTGENEWGISDPSMESRVTTTSITPVVFPDWTSNSDPGTPMLFTKPADINEIGVISDIKSATWNTKDTREKGMYSSILDTEKGNAWGLVDNDFGSYYQISDWDDGYSYPGWDKGVTITLNEKHKMNMVMFADTEDNTYYNGSIYYFDYEKNAEVKAENVTTTSRTDGNGRRYHIIKLYDPIETDQIRICLARSGGQRRIGIAEVRLYNYDPIEREVLDLFDDDMHLILKSDVTSNKIEGLRARVNEEHPYCTLINAELDNAAALLRDGNLKDADVVTIQPGITSKQDGHLGFSGLNSWQPLGITAYAGEELVIYVGHKGKNTGTATNLQVVVTQYHAESSPFMEEIKLNLKVGRNEVTVPGIVSFNYERGGSVYIQYNGNDANDVYGVRVAGGQKIPVLNLYKVDQNSDTWLQRTEEYVGELEKYVASLETLHNRVHKGSKIEAVDYDYDEKNCFLGATEIMLDQMMYSVSGQQILKGLGEGSTHDRAVKLSESLKAMEGMMTLFYHHKGLSNASGAGSNNRLPVQHLNIRYHRMFAGAFMYASGNHIGIEWDSVAGLSGGVPVVSDDSGRYISGNYFGWGIAHEIGHDINQGTYAIAEVTNNYFSVLAQAKETNESVRFSYDDVYEKVTSNAIGRASNVFTQLGMYWQLHLAYDKGYNYKIYDTYQEQFDNLFFARVDTYARNVKAAPKKSKDEGVELTLAGNTDQDLMRLASAAAKKDLSEFFIRWGMVPDSGTMNYMSQFEKEDRAIYYVNDEARDYAVSHEANMSAETVKDKNVVGDVKITVDPLLPNQITLSLSNTASVKNAVLGYEIVRCSVSGGEKERRVVGFTTGDEFVDTVNSINNRVFTYEVTVVDKFLNRSATKELEPVKVSHDGSYDKSQWTVTTNMVSRADVDADGTEEDPCDPEIVSAITTAFDNNKGTVYTGDTLEDDPEIVIDLKENKAVTALKYTSSADGRITEYSISISSDGESWTEVGSGTFSAEAETETVYFTNGTDNWVLTYDASYVKLVAKGQSRKSISIGEIDILGPTGDNVEFITGDNTTPAFGYLLADFAYDQEGGKIPAGSLVFVGQYKGNPAYNTVILYDKDGNIVGGVKDGTLVAHQIIMANVPEKGDLGETSNGRFIYWIEPDADNARPAAPGTVRAELYRVDKALTNEGQRLVSDTKLITIPDELPQITLSGSGE